jgi:epoxyqueuosine reductase
MFSQPKIVFPFPDKRILLHSCCAPCSGGIITTMINAGLECTVFFYNPNIHPQEEYQRRKAEQIRFAQKMHIPFVDADFDPDNWLERVKGLEEEPEQGRRCTACFDMRLERSALFSHENNFSVFTSSFGISRWKNMDQVNKAGLRAAARYPGLSYWAYNWRKEGGTQLMSQVSTQEQFYRQKYCGCLFSFRNLSKH